MSSGNGEPWAPNSPAATWLPTTCAVSSTGRLWSLLKQSADGGTARSAAPLWLAMAMAGANLLALSDWPYGYYQFLRIVVTGYAIWLVAHQSTAGTKVWPWIFGVVAVLYNPVFKINMELDTRAVIKVIVALLVLAEVFASLERAQT